MNIRDRYGKELKAVYEKLNEMCSLTERAIEKSINALIGQDKDMAKKVIESDKEIDLLERSIEQDCLKILLMEQPVAKDFRHISAALKMITDLERIADQAGDISELVLQFKDEEYIKKIEHIPLMASLAVAMVKDGVESYINGNLETAQGLEKRDDKVDEYFNAVKNDLVELIRKDGKNADQAILLMMIAKYIERIADHAVNIGEWTEYAETGNHPNPID